MLDDLCSKVLLHKLITSEISSYRYRSDRQCLIHALLQYFINHEKLLKMTDSKESRDQKLQTIYGSDRSECTRMNSSLDVCWPGRTDFASKLIVLRTHFSIHRHRWTSTDIEVRLMLIRIIELFKNRGSPIRARTRPWNNDRRQIEFHDSVSHAEVKKTPLRQDLLTETDRRLSTSTVFNGRRDPLDEVRVNRMIDKRCLRGSKLRQKLASQGLDLTCTEHARTERQTFEKVSESAEHWRTFGMRFIPIVTQI